jgi:hypothetical protein
MEDQEPLKTTAVVGHTSNLVENLVDEFFAHGVMASSIVVGGILFPRDHLLRMEQASVGACADLVDDVRLQIAVDGSRDIFAVACGRMVD